MAQTNRCLCPWLNESRDPFGKDLAGTVSGLTEKLAHLQSELHAEACAGQIRHHASISAMAVFGKTKTTWTGHFTFVETICTTSRSSMVSMVAISNPAGRGSKGDEDMVSKTPEAELLSSAIECFSVSPCIKQPSFTKIDGEPYSDTVFPKDSRSF